LHMLVNFNRIWVLHISVFWMYTVSQCHRNDYCFR
jgi:1,3-beta-glucan synthase